MRNVTVFVGVCMLLSALFLLPANGKAQSFINFSRYVGGNGEDDVSKMQVINGETYLVTLTNSTNFPVTNGTAYNGNTDIAVTKFNAAGAVVYSTYIGSTGYDNFYAMKIINGEVYLLGTADSSGYPVTNGSVFKGRTDVVFTKLTVNGDIAFSTYLGGSKSDFPTNDLSIVGNDVIIGGFTLSEDFPVTSGGYNGGSRDGFVTKINMQSGLITASILVGGSLEDTISGIYVENGFVFVVGNTFSVDIPVTIGNSPGPFRNIFVFKLALNNFSTQYSRYIGGNSNTPGAIATVLNGEVHLTGYTFVQNLPTTNGTSFSGLANDYIDGFYIRLNSDGGFGFSTYLGTEGSDYLANISFDNGDVYLTGTCLSNINPHHWDVLVFKLGGNGNIIYTKKLSTGPDFQSAATVLPLNSELYLSGVSNGPDFPVTNGSQFYNGGSGYFAHLDASGNIVYASFLGKMSSLLPLQYANNKFYLAGTTNLASYPVTDSSNIHGSADNLLAVLNPDGSSVFGTYIGGTVNDIPLQIAADNSGVYIAGITNSPDYPVTENGNVTGVYDQYLTKISFCPGSYLVTDDTLQPKNQTVCKFGLANMITGVKISVAAGGLPVLYENGIAVQQSTTIEATYQWQFANAATGPWTNIPGAIFKDYRPVLGATDQYYRRLSFASAECGSSLIHTSDTALVSVNYLVAPVISTTAPLVTCPGSPITIGGNPTVSGGNPPYTSYNWDNGATNIANPVVSPPNNTIYTLIVTDAQGCQQIGQSVVLTYKADAGVDKSNCAGVAVKIGTPQIAGINGISYDWQPATALDNPAIAQPFANPPIITDYTLTLNVIKSNGGTCSTKDTVKVTPVAAPVTSNFAGPDKIMCLRNSVTIGTAAEPGFTYTWSPGSYLTNNTSSITNYYAGNLLIPSPDPAILNLTAQKGGCSFSDQVTVTTIESRAGFLQCGPRIVGLPDRTPNINETYTWSLISGPGSFTGATDLPQVPVSASVGGTSVYGLTVSYNGSNCVSQVEVPAQCIGCNTHITVDAKYGCPGFGINGGDVTLNAFSNVQDAVYTWQPQAGLSAYTGNSVQLTDNVPRTYTVTATSLSDTSIHCSNQITVNDPAFSIPVFSVNDTTGCANVPIIIGPAPVAGYNYEWIGPGLSNNNISNPSATVPFQNTYAIKVTDGNGCLIRDTMTLFIQNAQVDAGPDWQVCSNANIKLGTTAQPNTSYLWEPQSAPWQNNTNQFSAQPEVQVAADILFTVTATTSAGCVSTDQVQVTINNIPSVPDAPDKILCKGNSVSIGSPALPGVTYQWTPTSGLSNATIAQPVANPTATTTYSLTAIFPGSCVSSAIDQVIVTVSDPSFNLPNISYCPDNGPVSLGVSAPVNMTSYSWLPAQLVSNASIPNPSTLNPPPVITTIYTLTMVNADGCSYRDTVIITPLVTKPFAGADKTICKGQSTTIGSASNITGASITYSWFPATNLDNPASPVATFTATTGGIFTYILTKTDNAFSCSSKDTVVINVIDSLIPVMNSPTVCANSCVQVGTTPLPGTLYHWSPETGLSNPDIANPIACVGNNTVSYELSATNLNGCSSTAILVIGVNNLPAPQIIIPSVTACVGDNNIFLNPSITPAGNNYSYSWSPDNGTLSNINIPAPQVAIGNPGVSQYSLQVTDNSNGCSNIETTSVTVNNCSDFSNIGDFLWFDTNTNGIQDPGEDGVSNQLVRLYNSAGFNVANTVTNADGLYLFTNVPPGNDYYVVFSLPTGFSFTLQNAGGTTANDNSKADPTGRSNNFNVPAGTSVLNIDAGIRPTGCVPVTLLSFTGILQNGKVKLYWQTTAEYNNRYFYVERSNDGIHFISIGRVDGNGTTSLPHSYTLTDPNPANGINYYRLKQVDFDGYAAYSHIVPIELSNSEIISAYYNQFNHTIQLNFRSQKENVTVKLFANNAQLIKTHTIPAGTNNDVLVLPAIANGIYILQMGNKDFNYVQKLLISR